MTDRFARTADSLSSPATHAFPITPDDDGALPETTRAIYVGTGGTLVLRLASGAVVTFTGIPSGMLLPVRADRVPATGTTAEGLIGLV